MFRYVCVQKTRMTGSQHRTFASHCDLTGSENSTLTRILCDSGTVQLQQLVDLTGPAQDPVAGVGLRCVSVCWCVPVHECVNMFLLLYLYLCICVCVCVCVRACARV